MRVLLATGSAVALVALGSGAEAPDLAVYRGACGGAPLPSGHTDLSAPLEVATQCGTFLIDERGVRVLAKAGSASGGAGQAVTVVQDQPLGWTRAGLRFTAASGVLTFRTRSGRRSMRIRTARNLFWFDTRSRTILFVSSREQLVRTDGHRSRALGSVSSLGLNPGSQIHPLPSGRIVLHGRRILVLGPNGAVVAADDRRGRMPTESRDGAIAIISTEKAGNFSRARESVRLLRRGERSSQALYVNDFSPSGCGRWSSLAWRGEALLYSTTEGKVVVIDTGADEHVDLTGLVERLPGEFLSAAWA